MAIQRTRANQVSDEQIAQMYNQLLALDKTRAPRQQKTATRWTDGEFHSVSGYAIRVAKNHTLDEFKEFVRTGHPVHPVKMTASEMQLLLGGGPDTDWTDWITEMALLLPSS
jgi:hypothetical protein